MNSSSVMVQPGRPREAGADAAPAPSTMEWLIDNDDAYRAIASAVQTATKSVFVSQLGFDADFTVPCANGDAGTPFIDLLLTAANEREVDVRILLNATILLDTLKPLRRYLSSNGIHSPNMQLRGVSFFPHLLHAKMVIVDSEAAFLVGSPFVNGYWDSSAHRPHDEMRPTGELGGRPVHDVSVQVEGKAARDVEREFFQLWDVANKETHLSQQRFDPTEPAPHATSVRIDVTAPAGVIASRPRGSTAILRTLERALAGARSLVYVEQQYLSCRRVFTSLRDALDREPELEIIIVSNQNPDITAYAQWQRMNLEEFGMLDHERVGVFALWSAAALEDRIQINQVFVHSKVVIVDDECAMCGSANLDGVSLHSYGADFSGWIGRRVFRNVRNFDITATVDSRIPGMHAPAKSLRHRLWREHLGVDFDQSARPAGGWLPLWKQSARQNIQTLQSGAVPLAGVFVLPFSAENQPSRQLGELDLQQGGASLELLFNPGWFERRFNLRWVRNMFL
ncbi:MAG: hypothetical protein H0W69_04140 [Gemmatimonadaceae bacterium]|nr:hypothetical protein [Gemmatimonadaceae bacterium]